MSRWSALLPLLFALLPAPALRAQVASDVRRPMIALGYATATTAQPEMGTGHQLGGSGGMIFQHSRLLAVDFRGVILSARVPLHTYLGEIGTRVTPSVSRRWQPYAGVLAGYGHSGYRASSQALWQSTFGFAWTADFGLDMHLRYGLDWRVAEYSYSHIFAGTGSSPTMLNTGVVYRFKSPGRTDRTM